MNLINESKRVHGIIFYKMDTDSYIEPHLSSNT